MAVVNKMELGRELFRTISQINRAIEVVEKEAEAAGVTAYQFCDLDGNRTLVSLLSAKAQALLGMAIVNQRDRF